MSEYKSPSMARLNFRSSELNETDWVLPGTCKAKFQ